MILRFLGIRNLKTLVGFLLAIFLGWIFYHAFVNQDTSHYSYLGKLDLLIKLLSTIWLAQFVVLIKWPRLMEKINSTILFKTSFLIILYSAPILFIITAFLGDAAYSKFGLPPSGCSDAFCGIGALLAVPMAVVIGLFVSVNSMLLGFKFFTNGRYSWLYIIISCLILSCIAYFLAK